MPLIMIEEILLIGSPYLMYMHKNDGVNFKFVWFIQTLRQTMLNNTHISGLLKTSCYKYHAEI